MARDVLKKLAEGKKLDNEDVQYAVDRGIKLPEEYGEQVHDRQVKMQFGSPVPGEPLFQTGPAFEMPGGGNSGPGVFLNADMLGELKADVLDEIGEALGIEDMPRKKADKVATLVGAEPGAGGDEDEEDEDDEEFQG